MFILIADQNNELHKPVDRENSDDVSQRHVKMVSSINLNIPAAGLGSRPASIISTSTVDEGGFNEPSPEIKAKLRPHEDSVYHFPVPGESTVVQQKSIDSDVMYHLQPPAVITNSVLAELESQESFNKDSTNEFLQNERQFENGNRQAVQSVMEPLFIHTSGNKSAPLPDPSSAVKSKESEQLLLSKYERSVNESESSVNDSVQTSSSSVESGVKLESEPFLVSRTALPIDGELNTSHTESPKSEASILDLQDVEYADASDEECKKETRNISAAEAEAMTAAEAENLLSSRYVYIYFS